MVSSVPYFPSKETVAFSVNRSLFKRISAARRSLLLLTSLIFVMKLTTASCSVSCSCTFSFVSTACGESVVPGLWSLKLKIIMRIIKTATAAKPIFL